MDLSQLPVSKPLDLQHLLPPAEREAPVKVHNRKSFQGLLSDSAAGDPQILPPEERENKRKQIRALKAQLSHERQARRDAEQRLQYLKGLKVVEPDGATATASHCVTALADLATSEALRSARTLSARKQDGL